MAKQKTHKGIQKRFKKTKPKRKKYKLVYQSKGRGSKHLKTKQSNARKRRIKQKKSKKVTKSIKRLTAKLR